ncbi:MAG: TOBE domain-containing protein [Pseudomonadota bacterium]
MGSSTHCLKQAARFQTSARDLLPLTECRTGQGAIVLRPQNLEVVASAGRDTLPGKVIHREFLDSQIRYIIETSATNVIVDQFHHIGHDWRETGNVVHLKVDTNQAVVIRS